MSDDDEHNHHAPNSHEEENEASETEEDRFEYQKLYEELKDYIEDDGESYSGVMLGSIERVGILARFRF